MRRPLMKATPAMIQRALNLYRPFDRPTVLPAKPKTDDQQLDLTAKPVERKDEPNSQK